jgi:hypothetical protein
VSLILVQVRGLVKGDVVVTPERDRTVKAVVPNPRIEDNSIVMFTDSAPVMERENGELVRIRLRKRPVY